MLSLRGGGAGAAVGRAGKGPWGGLSRVGGLARALHMNVPGAEENEEAANGDIPKGSFRRKEALAIVKFAGPALSIPLCDPIMSCVDAVCIGQFASTVELAALGPNIVIFNFISYTFQFMSIATTISVSNAMADGDKKKAGRIVSTAVWITVLAGIAMAIPLFISGEAALAATGSVPELLQAGLGYLRIRLLSCPAVLCTMVLQAGLLAQKDSVTPLLAVLISGGFNIVGDIFLIRTMKMGLAGAAWATTAAQYVALIVLLLLGYSKNAKNDVALTSERPTKQEFKPFLSAVGPLFFLYVSKNVCYLMLQSLSTTFSTATCAAHQAMWSGWAILSFCGTPLEQCAQVFLPTYLRADDKADKEGKKGVVRRRSSAQFIQVLVTVAGVTGLFLGLIAAGIPYVPQFFTKDASLYPIMQSFAPFMFLSIFTAPFTISLDGVMMALNDVKYLLKCQVANTAILASFLLYSHRAGLGILSVWYGVVLFFGLRLVENLSRVVMRGMFSSNKRPSSLPAAS